MDHFHFLRQIQNFSLVFNLLNLEQKNFSVTVLPQKNNFISVSTTKHYRIFHLVAKTMAKINFNPRFSSLLYNKRKRENSNINMGFFRLCSSFLFILAIKIYVLFILFVCSVAPFSLWFYSKIIASYIFLGFFRC